MGAMDYGSDTFGGSVVAQNNFQGQKLGPKFCNKEVSSTFFLSKVDHITVETFKTSQNASETFQTICKGATIIRPIPPQRLQTVWECTIDFV